MQMRAVSGHGCIHQGALQPLSLGAERVSPTPTPAPLAVIATPETLVTVVGLGSEPTYRPPPGIASRPASLLALRI